MCIDSSLHSEVVIQRRIELICKDIPKGYYTVKIKIMYRLTKALGAYYPHIMFNDASHPYHSDTAYNNSFQAARYPQQTTTTHNLAPSLLQHSATTKPSKKNEQWRNTTKCPPLPIIIVRYYYSAIRISSIFIADTGIRVPGPNIAATPAL